MSAHANIQRKRKLKVVTFENVTNKDTYSRATIENKGKKTYFIAARIQQEMYRGNEVLAFCCSENILWHPF